MIGWGCVLSRIKYIEPEKIVGWAKELGVDGFVPEMGDIINANEVFERLSPLAVGGVDKGVLKVGEASDILLRVIGADPTNANHFTISKLITKELSDHSRLIKNLARGNDAAEIIRRGQRWVFDTWVGNKASRVHTLRMNQKMLGSILDKLDLVGKVAGGIKLRNI